MSRWLSVVLNGACLILTCLSLGNDVKDGCNVVHECQITPRGVNILHARARRHTAGLVAAAGNASVHPATVESAPVCLLFFLPHQLDITINGGMQMPGWFDLYDWPIAVGSKDDRDGKLAAVAQIEQEVVKLKQQGDQRLTIEEFCYFSHATK